MSDTVTLSPESIAALAREIVAVQSAATRPELSRSEAMGLTGHRHPATFSAWCRSHRVRSISRGRYRRSAIMRALGASS